MEFNFDFEVLLFITARMVGAYHPDYNFAEYFFKLSWTIMMLSNHQCCLQVKCGLKHHHHNCQYINHVTVVQVISKIY